MKVVEGFYGHNPREQKLYAYLAGDNYRTGQNVVAPVTNKRTGKTYNTMFTIARTSKENTEWSQNEILRLEAKGINLKTIGGREIMSLPGASDYKSASEWGRRSNEMYKDEIRQRLMSFGGENDTSIARTQLLSF